MELAAVNTPATAFVAGLVTSVHCAGMCGPLACLLGPSRGERVDLATIHSVYHGTRLLSYGVLGAVAGAAGAAPAAWFDFPLVRVLPWVLVLYLVLVAVRPGQRWPSLALLGRVQVTVRDWTRGRSGVQVALIMGSFTPVLPCGPLYFLIAVAGFAGSALAGAELLLAFGLGTVPLLWLVQANLGWWRVRVAPPTLARMRTALALVTVGVLVWRLRGDFGLIGPTIGSLVCH